MKGAVMELASEARYGELRAVLSREVTTREEAFEAVLELKEILGMAESEMKEALGYEKVIAVVSKRCVASTKASLARIEANIAARKAGTNVIPFRGRVEVLRPVEPRSMENTMAHVEAPVTQKPATKAAAAKMRKAAMKACSCRLCALALNPPMTFAEYERLGLSAISAERVAPPEPMKEAA